MNTMIKITQVDAFTNIPFQGNPAAVCILNTAKSDDWMQKVAQEMNLSETAFLVAENDGFRLRWFTPTVEVPLCGHATLASSHVLWSEGYLAPEKIAKFYTKSGVLIAQLQDNWIELDFPVNYSQIVTDSTDIIADVLDVELTSIQSVYINSLGYLVELKSADLVTDIKPNFEKMQNLTIGNMIVTSICYHDYDFVSRFFAPELGINEDPVTGAAHCCLAPFWRDKLKKDEFLAYQASSRGGVVRLGYNGGDRVKIAGQAVTIMQGELFSN